MKTTLLVLIVFCTAAAFGQASSGVSSVAQPIHIPDHPIHASQGQMGNEVSLLGGGPGTYTYAQGERPLWEFGPVTEPTPLGDVARACRKEKEGAKKAAIIYEKQGS